MIKNINDFNEKKSAKGYYWNYNEAPRHRIEKLKTKYNLPEIVAKILANRETNDSYIDEYLKPSLKDNLPDPNIIINMEESIKIIIKKIHSNKGIGLLGDYDVDGASSSAVLYKYFNDIGIYPEVYIPNRLNDGYGISKNSIDFFLKKKIKFLIALDCGTNDLINIEYAKEKGIDILVIDHHEVKSLGKPISIINPKLVNDESGLDILCTAGLAFLFVIGLNRELRKKGFFNNRNEPNLKNLLDFVAIGTVCDLVPLKKINRLLVKKGLDILSLKSNKGLKILKEKLKIERKLKASDLSFYLGPCINAAGRIGDSKLGFNLLTNNDENALDDIANKLIVNNQERKTLENLAYIEAKKLIKEEDSDDFIFLYSKKWHPGIVGIIASKLVEEYNKPAFVISIQGIRATGSVRSVKHINISNIIDLLKKNKLIDAGGGHSMAGGLSVQVNKIKQINLFFRNNSYLFKTNSQNSIQIDVIADIANINLNIIEKLEKLEPYGFGNKEPRFVIRNLRASFTRFIGKEKNHILCSLEDIFGNQIKAIAFNSFYNKIGLALKEKKSFHALGKIEINQWLSERKLQFFIEDLILI